MVKTGKISTKAMFDQKKKVAPKKAVEKKVETPKPTAKTLGELKKEFAAARKANPEKDDALRASYLKDKIALQGK